MRAVAGGVLDVAPGGTPASLVIYVAGGATADGTSRTVFRFDPATFRVTAAGQLPVPAGYAAAVSSGGVGYLIGGEDGARRMATVTAFRLVPTRRERSGRITRLE